jgi:hypothetical protein
MREPIATGLLIAGALVFSCSIQAHADSEASRGRTPLSAAFSARNFDDFVRAIHLHESDGRLGQILGDGGRSYGPLQISYRAWRDAVQYDRSIGGKYTDCRNLEYSKRVMKAYLQRYDSKALAAGDWEACARLWNSGPAWRTKMGKTNEYWAAIKGHLVRVNS